MKIHNKAKLAFTFEKRVFGKCLGLLLFINLAFTPYIHAQATSLDSVGTTVFDKVMLKKTGYTCLGYLRKVNQAAFREYGPPASSFTVHYSPDLPEVYINGSRLFFYCPQKLKAFKKIVSYTYRINPSIKKNGENVLIKQLKFKAK